MPDLASLLNIDELLKPISPEQPAGVSLEYSPLYEEIKEARRADEALAQGDWTAPLKTAQWPKVKELSMQALAEKSKDLQLACWLAEALIQLHGFPGLYAGLQILNNLLVVYWESLYPALEDGNAETRAARLEWLNANLPRVINDLPLTSAETGAYGWRRWRESRDIENLGRQDPQAMEDALASGKINTETFDRAVAGTPASFYETLHQDASHCQDMLFILEKTVDERFMTDAPNLRRIKEAVENCYQLATRLAVEKGVLSAPANEPAPQQTAANTPIAPVSQPGGAMEKPLSGTVRSREEALRHLNEVAHFFKETEPHSPVSYLIERAVRWGNMPLEQWLRDVIKDDTVLYSLRDTLGIKPKEE